MTRRQPITLTEEMERGLAVVNERTGIPMARLIRDGIRMVLSQYGIEVKADVQRRDKKHPARAKARNGQTEGLTAVKSEARYEETPDEA